MSCHGLIRGFLIEGDCFFGSGQCTGALLSISRYRSVHIVGGIKELKLVVIDNLDDLILVAM